MSLKQTLIGTIAKLNTLGVGPAVMRDAVAVNADGEPELPEQCIIVDIITNPVSKNFDSIYGNLLLQVGCWSRSAVTSLDMAEAVRQLLAGDWRYELERINPMQTDGPPGAEVRGVLADYTVLHDF